MSIILGASHETIAMTFLHDIPTLASFETHHLGGVVVNLRFVHGDEVMQKLTQIAFEQGRTLLRNCHTILFVVNVSKHDTPYPSKHSKLKPIPKAFTISQTFDFRLVNILSWNFSFVSGVVTPI